MTEQHQSSLPGKREHITPIRVLDALKILATTPGLPDALIQGYSMHGEPFLAFIAGTDGVIVPQDELIDLFNASHVTTGRHFGEAYRKLLAYHADEESVLQQNGEAGERVTDILEEFADRLRRLIDEKYLFVEGSDHWYVFDSHAIERALE